MRNRNAARHAAQNFVIAVAVMILAGCGQNPGGDYTSSSPILPAVADTVGSSLDLTIPLDVAVAASNPQRFAVRGKYIAIDPGSTGQANLRLNSISDTARLAYPGAVFNPGDFIDLYFDYQAQPGKFLHVIYGDSPDILSAGSRVAIDAGIAPQTFVGEISPASGNLAVITAAQNVRGVKIIGGVMATRAAAAAGTAATVRLTAAYPGAPDAFIAALTIFGNATAATYQSVNIAPIYIAPGVALTFFTDLTGAVGYGTLILNYQLL